jgi:hypothetical protein
MKYLITESKINQIILDYLNDNVYPDYDWGPDLYDFYKDEIRKSNSYSFPINDVEAYAFYGEYANHKNVLEISEWLSNKLTALFGDYWIPVFNDWFEERSGLKIGTTIIDK